MIHATSKSDDEHKMTLKYRAQSPSIDENSCEGSSSGGDGSLKKGPWTSAEDAILVDYIKKHGEGNWNAVQKHTGLSRCGKSCRLRWTNHLRPDLKKGAFTSDEEKLIVKLHAKMGNRWAKMASHLPGRTDNEIKNFWNTRIKRLQRAGLPLYPPNICFQSLNENQSQCGGEFDHCDNLDNELLQPCSFDTADVVFDNFKVNQGTSSYTQQFPDFPVSVCNQGLGSQDCGVIFPTLNHLETLFPSFHHNITCGPPVFEQFSSDSIHQPFAVDFPNDSDLGSGNLASMIGGLSGSRILPNGNSSTSKTLPVGAKLELPSFQYPETDLSSWLVSPPTPPLVAVDGHVESSSSVSVQSDSVSPRNSGLLEALLHEAQAMAFADKLSQKILTPSNVVLSDNGESTALNVHNVDRQDCGDPISPLGCSPASVYSAYNPLSCVSLFDESSPGKVPDDGDVKLKHIEDVGCQGKETKNPPPVGFFSNEIFRGIDWCHNIAEVHSTMGDTMANFLGDLCDDYMQVPLDRRLR